MMRCRIVDKNGEIMEGKVATHPVAMLSGITIEAPAQRIPTYTAVYDFSHFTDDGVAVYLEAL